MQGLFSNCGTCLKKNFYFMDKNAVGRNTNSKLLKRNAFAVLGVTPRICLLLRRIRGFLLRPQNPAALCV
ncbi:hypothetical protein CLOLEP_02606 [[Clostridium] leptum DSM 753]|uniref:Uncharacterized protein n=1 Tax=[Clostridium] leptum DSM 753 TaxID=428125 RepID=A7VVJ4_9FIRM|nr:hypothetical protein CLOLEP_02606 [[Clostridium] leptum DSM 753]